MKKLLVLFLTVVLASCNDGDFDVPEFQFDDTVYSCGEYVLHVKSDEGTETLALTLSSTEIGTEIGEASYDISSTREINYRIFDDAVSSSYYCQSIPPIEPEVLKELIAETGTINITTSEVYTDLVLSGYSYEITISDLLFIDGKKSVYYETMPFGTFEISI